MKKGKTNYVITEEFITDKENPTEEDLKTIFNKKYFKYIMRREKSIFNINEKENDLPNKKYLNKR